MVTASKIKETRELLGENQARFAERFGVDQSTIHRWETEGPPSRGPGRKALERVIADVEGGVAAPAQAGVA